MEGEEFRPVEGYEDYEVSNKGRVYSKERYYEGGFGAVCKTGGKFMRPYINRKRQNRVQVCLCRNGKAKQFFVSVLVAKAFPEICGEWFKGCEVDHIDCDPMNNVAENLKCVTKSENMRNPITRQHISDSIDREARSERMRGDKNPARRCMTEEWRAKIGESQRWKKRPSVCKKVEIERNGLIKKFNSVTEAAEFLGTRPSDVSSVCRGRYSEVRGWFARYNN